MNKVNAKIVKVTTNGDHSINLEFDVKSENDIRFTRKLNLESIISTKDLICQLKDYEITENVIINQLTNADHVLDIEDLDTNTGYISLLFNEYDLLDRCQKCVP